MARELICAMNELTIKDLEMQLAMIEMQTGVPGTPEAYLDKLEKEILDKNFSEAYIGGKLLRVNTSKSKPHDKWMRFDRETQTHKCKITFSVDSREVEIAEVLDN